MKLDVTVYSSINCGYCVLMKNFLNEQNILYKEVNIQEKPEIVQELMAATGRLGVPQTNINSNWVLGYDPISAMKIIQQLTTTNRNGELQ
ncbi:glutaredoxin family protein [Viridibacillus sp. FSL H8-0110]|uniref:glutaredoxin family protein n=1 Tax=Viridibacillus sp. FSL H8-0110 TaxID=2921376 RepID=UPI0030F8DA03